MNVDLDHRMKFLPYRFKRRDRHIPLAFLNLGCIFGSDPGYLSIISDRSLQAPGHLRCLLARTNSSDLTQYKDIARKAKLMFLNYPNNPHLQLQLLILRGSCDYASENEIIVVHETLFGDDI